MSYVVLTNQTDRLPVEAFGPFTSEAAAWRLIEYLHVRGVHAYFVPLMPGRDARKYYQ